MAEEESKIGLLELYEASIENNYLISSRQHDENILNDSSNWTTYEQISKQKLVKSATIYSHRLEKRKSCRHPYSVFQIEFAEENEVDENYHTTEPYGLHVLLINGMTFQRRYQRFDCKDGEIDDLNDVVKDWNLEENVLLLSLLGESQMDIKFQEAFERFLENIQSKEGKDAVSKLEPLLLVIRASGQPLIEVRNMPSDTFHKYLVSEVRRRSDHLFKSVPKSSSSAYEGPLNFSKYGHFKQVITSLESIVRRSRNNVTAKSVLCSSVLETFGKFFVYCESDACMYLNSGVVINYVIQDNRNVLISHAEFFDRFYKSAVELAKDNANLIALRDFFTSSSLSELDYLRQTLNIYSSHFEDNGQTIQNLENLIQLQFGACSESRNLIGLKCHFHNMYELIVSTGLGPPQDSLKLLFNAFFYLLGKKQLSDELFSGDKHILRLIDPADDTGYYIFVEIIIKDLNSTFHTETINFLKTYLVSLNIEEFPQRWSRRLLEELIAFSRKSNYISDLSYVLAQCLRIELYFAVYSKNTEGSLIRSFYSEFDEGSYSQYTEMYLIEATFVVLKLLSLELVDTPSHTESLLVFIQLLDCTPTLFNIVFKLSIDLESKKLEGKMFLLNEEKNNVMTALTVANKNAGFDCRNHLIEEKGPVRSDFAAFHYWLLDYSQEFESKSTFTGLKKSDEIFWALFDQIGKLNKASDFTNLKTREKRKPKKDFNQFFSTLTELRGLINPPGYFIKGGDTFYGIVADILLIYVTTSKEKTIDGILGSASKQINMLRISVEFVLDKKNVDINDVVNLDYSKIQADLVQTIMDFPPPEVLDAHNENYQIEVINNFKSKLLLLSSIVCVRLQLLGAYLQGVANRYGKVNLMTATEIVLKNIDDTELVNLGVPLEEKMAPDFAIKVAHCIKSKIYDKSMEKSMESLDKIKSKSSQLEQCLSFIEDFDANMERKLSTLKFSLKKMWEAFFNIEVNRAAIVKGKLAAHHEGADFVPAIECFRLNTEFNQGLNRLSADISEFGNNQLLALHIIDKLSAKFSQYALAFRVGTGQGKTLIEASTAVKYLTTPGRNITSKVIIFTAFDHLAKRDHNNMKIFYEQFTCFDEKKPISSVHLGKLEDFQSAVNAQVIYADTKTLHELVRDYSAKSYHQDQAVLDFIFASWKHHLIILDEMDVLLAKDEHPVLHNFFKLFVQKAGKKEKIVGLVLNNKFKLINGFFQKSSDSIAADFRTIRPPSAVFVDEGGTSLYYSGSTGYHLSINEFKLPPTLFSWKLKMVESGKVVGFSGSIDFQEVKETLSTLFNIAGKVIDDPSEQNAGFLNFEIPLFFSPKDKFSPNVKCVEAFVDFNQKSWKDDTMPAMPSTFIGEDTRTACDTREDWLEKIRKDCDRAIANEQPVLIFVHTDSVRSVSEYLKLDKSQVYSSSKDGEDGNEGKNRLQDIAIKGRISLCTKQVGRGADIRVHLGIANGLHVIIASPDYKEEILQQVGRTGRMNRHGTFSFIFCRGDIVPDYDKNDQKVGVMEKRLKLMNFSREYFSSSFGRDEDKYLHFVWCLKQYSDQTEVGRDLLELL